MTRKDEFTAFGDLGDLIEPSTPQVAFEDSPPAVTRKVAIVGFAGTKDRAPYTDSEFEIWSVNNLYASIPRTDRIFQMHAHSALQGEHHGITGNEHLEYLQNATIPIYMQQHYPDIPCSIPYPLELMTEEFGVPRLGDEKTIDPYFTNSISFMIALAIHMQFEEIHIYGVDMAVGTEYNEQRPSCEYYIGIARGRGIKVFIPTESDLLKTRFVYGYEDEKRHAWTLKMEQALKEMQSRKAESDQIIRNQQSVSDKYEGAQAAIVEMARTWQ